MMQMMSTLTYGFLGIFIVGFRASATFFAAVCLGKVVFITIA